MPDPATPDRAAWRRELRETASALFGPVPDRVEVTATFECVCDGGCPRGCIHCVACSADLPPPAVPEHVIEAAADLIGREYGSEEDEDAR